jgi:hypothetical protein
MMQRLRQLRYVSAVLAVVMSLVTAHACELESARQHGGSEPGQAVPPPEVAAQCCEASPICHSGDTHDCDDPSDEKCCPCICHVPVTPTSALVADSEPAPTWITFVVTPDPSSHVPEPIQRPPILG